MKRKAALFAFFGIIATGFIFYNSLKTAPESSKSSEIIVDFLITWFLRFSVSLDRETIIVLVRKTAHIAEFFAQAMFFSLAYFFGKSKFSQRVVYVMFFGLLTACADEFLQNFVEGRGSLVGDIWIDFIGILLAAGIYLIISMSSGRRRI